MRNLSQRDGGMVRGGGKRSLKKARKIITEVEV